MTNNPIRGDRRYDTARLKFLGVCELHNVVCWLCGKAIDYKAKSQTPLAFELDHALPLQTHPELAYESYNFRASHSHCNRSRGAKTIAVAPRTGNTWVPADW